MPLKAVSEPPRGISGTQTKRHNRFGPQCVCGNNYIFLEITILEILETIIYFLEITILETIILEITIVRESKIHCAGVQK